MKYFGIIGPAETRHFYEAVVEVNGERGEIEIQANSLDEAQETAKAEGYAPESIKFVC